MTNSEPGNTNILQEGLLTVVGGEDGDLLGRVSDKPHVHVDGHDELGLGQVLVEEGTGLAFTHSIEVRYIDELIVETETRIGSLVISMVENMGKVSKSFVSPVVE